MEMKKTSGIAVLVAGLAASACGTTMRIVDKGVWYDCNTQNEYAIEDPCYGPVQEYLAAHRGSSGGGTSSSSFGMGRERFSASDYRLPPSSGNKSPGIIICKEKPQKEKK